jgi:hypothetical protein
MAISETFVIDTELVDDCRVEGTDMDTVLNDVA